MLVYEYKCKILFKKNLNYEDFSEKMASFIDSVISKDDIFLKLHQSTGYKNYVFDMAYKPEKDKVYKIEKIYTVRIRTINKELVHYLYKNMRSSDSEYIHCIGGEFRVIPKKIFEKVYTLTPALIKSKEGYWEDNISRDEYEERIKVNLIKKYNDFTGEKLDENFKLYESLEFKNEKPVKFNYKGKVFLLLLYQ